MSYDFAMLFFLYSFFGWVTETVVKSLSKKHFINRGFFTGPFCYIYGFSGVLMSIVFRDLADQPVFLFLGCAVLATAIEWYTGKFLERINYHKWWDYSKKKWNFDGYICLQYSILWGILGLLAVKYVNHFFIHIFQWLPEILRVIAVWVLAGIALLDGIASFAAAFHIKKGMYAIYRWNSHLDRWTYRLGKWIVSHVERRMVKAYPSIDHKEKATAKKSTKFAEGCGFYKLFWLFFLGAFLGDIIETVFCRFSMGWWMSRSSFVWGPFSVVWGMAIVLATVLLYKDRERPDRHIFLIGTFLGGVYEYVCSVLTEIVFGKVFWDYSKIPFNLGGRINLLFCLFWGIAAVIWIKLLFPRISWLIEKIPKTPGKIITWIALIFMVVNAAVSMMALIRYDARANNEPADSAWEQLMDEYFDDTRMEVIYPSAKPR
ncbi:putative membrane protein [Catenibacillus scindens]|uniref:Putative membrane protein n=1 Tax=Catenibacillus scindens TaxID=673271 RepID=A0A7W8M6E3_9FIRM|nr:putative ABC transporter permease [Catenibacillus scindens]MBB5265899.1 putative membrane protein [Catenibacillus scindens]